MDTELPLKQITAVLNLFDAKGMTHERMTEILKSGILADVCDGDALLNNRLNVRIALGLEMDLEKPFILTMDYNQLRRTLSNAGSRVWGSRFYWINPDTADPRNTLIVGEGIDRVEAKVFRFDESFSLDEIFQGIATADKSRPWQSARLEHLCALGQLKGEDENNLSGITALGSKWMGHWSMSSEKKPCYPCTTMIGQQERLGISYHNDGFERWKWHGRYLGFRPLTEQV